MGFLSKLFGEAFQNTKSKEDEQKGRSMPPPAAPLRGKPADLSAGAQRGKPVDPTTPAQKGRPVPTSSFGQQGRVVSSFAPREGNSWGERMPSEENQFSYPGPYYEYFARIFREEFPLYRVEEEAEKQPLPANYQWIRRLGSNILKPLPPGSPNRNRSEEEARPIRTTYTFWSGRIKALIVELMSESRPNNSLRDDCSRLGIPYLRFYYDHHGWWNTRSYVVERVRKALRR